MKVITDSVGGGHSPVGGGADELSIAGGGGGKFPYVGGGLSSAGVRGGHFPGVGGGAGGQASGLGGLLAGREVFF